MKDFVTSDNKTLLTNDNKSFKTRKEEIMAFQFQLFTGSNPDTQYANVASKDALTFYLLSNGKGYLGSTLLFDSANSSSPVVFLSTAGTYTTYVQGKMYAITTSGVKLSSEQDAPDSPIGIYYATSTSVLTNLTDSAFTSSIASYIANSAIASDDADLTTDQEDFEGDDNTLMTSAAVVTFVNYAIEAALENVVTYTNTGDSTPGE